MPYRKCYSWFSIITKYGIWILFLPRLWSIIGIWWVYLWYLRMQLWIPCSSDWWRGSGWGGRHSGSCSDGRYSSNICHKENPALSNRLFTMANYTLLGGEGYIFFNHVKHSIYYKCGYLLYRFWKGNLNCTKISRNPQ